MFGVSIHPRYGGWFGFRGAVIFRDVQCPNLVQTQPLDVVSQRKDRIELLERFNYRWKDWSFRDIIEPVERYSEEQKEYFETLPKERAKLLEKLREDRCNTSVER